MSYLKCERSREKCHQFNTKKKPWKNIWILTQKEKENLFSIYVCLVTNSDQRKLKQLNIFPFRYSIFFDFRNNFRTFSLSGSQFLSYVRFYVYMIIISLFLNMTHFEGEHRNSLVSVHNFSHAWGQYIHNLNKNRKKNV